MARSTAPALTSGIAVDIDGIVMRKRRVGTTSPRGVNLYPGTIDYHQLGDHT